MDEKERRWLYLLIVVFVVFNVVTLSPLIPWQRWLIWSKPTPDRVVEIDVADYQFKMPAGGIEAKVGEYVQFVVTSQDVTYGFGVFRPDNTMLFQMQVVPGYQNKIVWQFNEPGSYDVRSTEYSGPRHSEMHVPDAIRVSQ